MRTRFKDAGAFIIAIYQVCVKLKLESQGKAAHHVVDVVRLGGGGEGRKTHAGAQDRVRPAGDLVAAVAQDVGDDLDQQPQ